MTLADLLGLIALAALAAFVLTAARSLSAMRDWQRRLGDSHATVYVRLGELLLWLARHVGGAARHKGRRAVHLRRALLALWLLAITAGTPLVTLVLASDPGLAGHGLALGGGIFGWTVLVESPAAVERVQRLSNPVDPLPALVRVFVITVLDVAICCLALSGAIGGEPLASMFAGAAFVAAADLASTLVGVAAAAFPDYPLLDPPGETRP
jgi:hypothetical protein